MRSGASTVLVLVAATLGCPSPTPPPPAHVPAPSPIPTTEPIPPPRPIAPWTIAVLSDLHVEPDGSIPARLPQVVAAVIARRPRLVVVTGDFTDGGPGDPAGRVARAPQWWRSARRALTPIRAAGIPVLPIAGNHDSCLPAYRLAYAAAWSDLDRWAAPLEIWGSRQPFEGVALDAAPFSYSVDLDGVHLVLAHVVDTSLDRSVARWIAGELAAARTARLRLVFGHVPLSSIMGDSRRAAVTELGRILAAGRADLYVAGHEHMVWDDDIPVGGGASLHQLLVGTTSASWQFEPGAAARRRAQCRELDTRLRCVMPHDGFPFELRRIRGHWLEAEPYTFTLITIDGAAIHGRAFAVDDHGSVTPFGTPRRDTAPP